MHCFVCNKKAPGDRGFFILKTLQAPAWCKPLLGASLRLVQALAWCKPFCVEIQPDFK